MELTSARSADIPALSGLFRLCFGTDADYETLFFTGRFRPEDTVVARLDQKVAAMVHRLPLSVLLHGEWVRGRYLYAVGTHPAHRGKGLSTLLLEECHRLAQREGEALSLLVPAGEALFSFYETRGFSTCCHRRPITVQAARESDIPFAAGSLASCRPLRDRYFGCAALYGGWDEAALDYAQRENALQGGWTLTFPGGYLVVRPEGEGLFCQELVPGPHPAEAVAAQAAAQLGRPWMRLSLWPEEEGPASPLVPYAMAAFYRSFDGASGGWASPYFGLSLD